METSQSISLRREISYQRQTYGGQHIVSDSFLTGMEIVTDYFKAANRNPKLIVPLGNGNEVEIGPDGGHNCRYCSCFCGGLQCEHCRFYLESHPARCFLALGRRSGHIGFSLRNANPGGRGRPVEENLINRVARRFALFPFGDDFYFPEGTWTWPGTPLERIEANKARMNDLELRNYQIMIRDFDYSDPIFADANGNMTSITQASQDVGHLALDRGLAAEMGSNVKLFCK